MKNNKIKKSALKQKNIPVIKFQESQTNSMLDLINICKSCEIEYEVIIVE